MLTLKYPECVQLVKYDRGLLFCRGVFRLKWCPVDSHHGNCTMDIDCFNHKISAEPIPVKQDITENKIKKWWKFWR